MLIYFFINQEKVLKYVYHDYTYQDALRVIDELMDIYGYDCKYRIEVA